MRWPRLTAEVLPLLTAISPLIGVATTVITARWHAPLVRPMALSNSAMTLLLVIAGLWLYEPSGTALGGVPGPGITWLASAPAGSGQSGGIGVRLALGMDGLSLWPALLLSLTVWAVLCCPGPAEGSLSSYCGWLMTSQALLLAACFSTDVISTLVCLEVALLPVFLLVGTCGEEGRRPAAGGFWLWQLAGSGMSLLGVTLLAVSSPWMQTDLVASRGAVVFDAALLADSIRQMLARSESAWHLWTHMAPWGAGLLLLGFLIRLPVFPFLGWYQSTLAAAPAGVAAVIVAAFPFAALVGWMRTGMPLFADNRIVAAALAVAALAGVFQSAVAMQSQVDLKRLLALFSSATLGLACVGLSVLNRDGIRGAWLLVLSQGAAIVVGLLLVQVLESRCGTRDLTRLPGLAERSPWLAALLTALLLGWGGIPLVWGVTALYTQLSASSTAGLWLIAGASIGLLGIAAAGIQAATSIWRASSAAGSTAAAGARLDIRGAELAALAPIVGLLLLVTAAPAVVMKSCDPVLRGLLHRPGPRAAAEVRPRSPSGGDDGPVREVLVPAANGLGRMGRR